MKDDMHIPHTPRADHIVGNEGGGVPAEEGADNLSGGDRRILFGNHQFDLRVVEREAKRHLGYNRRLDLLDEVVSDATLSLFEVPADRDIDDPDGYAAITTRRQVFKTLDSEQSRKNRENDWVDDVRIMRKVSKIRLVTDRMVNCFLVAMAESLTGRQREICFLVLAGRSFKEIAALLKVNRKTVYNDLKRLHTLFQEFCDNFDPDDHPPNGSRSDGEGAHPGIDPRSGRRINSSDDHRYCANNTSGWGASWVNGANINIIVSERLTPKVVERFLLRNGPLRSERPLVRTRHAPSGRNRQSARAQEFKRLLLDLPAFRGLHLGGGGHAGETRRCDSITEIIERLRT